MRPSRQGPEVQVHQRQRRRGLLRDLRQRPLQLRRQDRLQRRGRLRHPLGPAGAQDLGVSDLTKKQQIRNTIGNRRISFPFISIYIIHGTLKNVIYFFIYFDTGEGLKNMPYDHKFTFSLNHS